MPITYFYFPKCFLGKAELSRDLEYFVPRTPKTAL